VLYTDTITLGWAMCRLCRAIHDLQVWAGRYNDEMRSWLTGALDSVVQTIDLQDLMQLVPAQAGQTLTGPAQPLETRSMCSKPWPQRTQAGDWVCVRCLGHNLGSTWDCNCCGGERSNYGFVFEPCRRLHRGARAA